MTSYEGPERIDPENPRHHPIVKLWHQQRYNFVPLVLTPGPLLDAGCGIGYGTQQLALLDTERQVVGVDISDDAISQANSRYSAPNVEFLVDNLETMRLPYRFSTVVVFETIEHLDDPEKGLRNIRDHMLPDAILVISVPLGEWPGMNPYHKTVWNLDDFIQFVRSVGFLKGNVALEQPENWTGVFKRGD